jgi:hypothetical protein
MRYREYNPKLDSAWHWVGTASIGCTLASAACLPFLPVVLAVIVSVIFALIAPAGSVAR